ncbi:hypothetical protein TWF970_005768 [Orbilia oligospora]|uniref:Clr5 domain-containing protein n=1 Tax=Orbilia oligospora TaxID=2813651 RepID=A0A7C8RGA0_ORBOL|nr:hypothetical protein TWF970_005768 [Orbilia oligospora]
MSQTLQPDEGPLKLRVRRAYEPEIPWAALRETIERLYLHKNYSNKEIIAFFAEEQGLIITKSQLEYQIKKWKIRKNMKREDYIFSRYAFTKSSPNNTTGNIANEVYLNGIRQSPRKLRKGWRRHKAREGTDDLDADALRYHVSDGLVMGDTVLGATLRDTPFPRSPRPLKVGNRSRLEDNGLVSAVNAYRGDLSPGSLAHVSNTQRTRETPVGVRRPPGALTIEACSAVSRVKETKFILDFLQQTLFIMQNGLWDDIEWEPIVIKMIKSHKLGSLLACIMGLGMDESTKLGNCLVSAVCHRYQGEYDAEDLSLLLRCGCKPSVDTLRNAYQCTDAKKIQQLFSVGDIENQEILEQCRLAIERRMSGIFESFAFSTMSTNSALLESLERDWTFKLFSIPQEELLTFDAQSTVDFKIIPRSTSLLPELMAPAFISETPECELIRLPQIELLMSAIKYSHRHVVKVLSEKMDLKKPGYLIYTILTGDEATALLLLDAGANPNGRVLIPEVQGVETPPPSRHSDHIISTGKVYSVTPLLAAVRLNFKRIINRLLSAGANPNLEASPPPLYHCGGCDRIWYGRFTSECTFLNDYFREISPLELAIMTGSGRSVLERLWIAGARFRRPDTTWMVLLMYTKFGSSEFNFAADALLTPQSDSFEAGLGIGKRAYLFRLKCISGFGALEPQYKLLLKKPGLEPPKIVLQTYTLGRFYSMVYHMAHCTDGSRWKIIFDNLETIGDGWAVNSAFRILEEYLAPYLKNTSRDTGSRIRHSTQTLGLVEHVISMQLQFWYSDQELQGSILETIIWSAWQGVVTPHVLHRWIWHLCGPGGLKSSMSLVYGKPNANVVKIFLESLNRGEDQGRVKLNQGVFEAFGYFIDIGWGVNQGACDCDRGEITALDIILSNCVLDHTSFAILKRLRDAGARINWGGNHCSSLSYAIEARRDTFRIYHDKEDCWELQTIELLLQVEKEGGYNSNGFAVSTRISKYIGSPLQEAAYFGDLELAKLLLKAGMDVNLEAITRYPNLVFREFVKPCSGPRPRMKEPKCAIPQVVKGTPLEIAVGQGRQGMVELLLEWGAKVTGKAHRRAQSVPRILNLFPKIYPIAEGSTDMLDDIDPALTVDRGEMSADSLFVNL